MKEIKYYTPPIEEFHVGFEYEYKEDGKNKWTKEIFQEGRGLSYDGEIDSDEIRVKYLDREDIEELGWVYKTNFNIKDNSEVVFDLYVLELRMNFKKNILTIHNTSEEDYFSGLFHGIIKNKSELKKLMEQLNIR